MKLCSGVDRLAGILRGQAFDLVTQPGGAQVLEQEHEVHGRRVVVHPKGARRPHRRPVGQLGIEPGFLLVKAEDLAHLARARVHRRDLGDQGGRRVPGPTLVDRPQAQHGADKAHALSQGLGGDPAHPGAGWKGPGGLQPAGQPFRRNGVDGAWKIQVQHGRPPCSFRYNRRENEAHLAPSACQAAPDCLLFLTCQKCSTTIISIMGAWKCLSAKSPPG